MGKRILGVLAGNDTPEALLRFWASKADILIAADRGADHLLAAGHIAHIAVGDFDSSDATVRSQITDIYKVDDQSFSDCDKLLRFVENQGHTDLTIIGFEGDRLDHVLAGLGSFMRSPLNLRIVLRCGLATLLRGATDCEIATQVGQVISILPLAPTFLVTTQGLDWEIRNAHFELGSNWSLSNRAQSDSLRLQFESGALLVIQEYEMENYEGW